MTPEQQQHRQRMEALRNADKVRLGRCALKRQVKTLPTVDGRALLAGILENPAPILRTALVMDVLQWPRRVGPDLARKMMISCGVGLTVTVGALTPRQRVALAARLRDMRPACEWWPVAQFTEAALHGLGEPWTAA